MARIADADDVAAEARGQEEVEKGADQQRAQSAARCEKSAPCSSRISFQRLAENRKPKACRAKASSSSGQGGGADDREDLARPGDDQDQVQQQAETEDELEQRKKRFSFSCVVPGMKFFIGLQQVAEVQRGVFFGRGQAGMAQQLLDDAQVRPPLQQVGGEGMAQQVGMDMRAGNGSGCGRPAAGCARPSAAEAAAAGIDEDQVLRRRELQAQALQVAPHDRGGLLVKGDDAFLSCPCP